MLQSSDEIDYSCTGFDDDAPCKKIWDDSACCAGVRLDSKPDTWDQAKVDDYM